MSQRLSSYYQNIKLRRISSLLVILIVAAIGTYLLAVSHAVSPYASINADKGTLANGATIQSDSSANDGKYVRFGQRNQLIQGINVHLLYGDKSVTNPLLNDMASAGFKWIRVDIDLKYMPSKTQINPTDLAAMENAVNQASSLGLKVMFTLKSTPSWESSGKDDPWQPADYGAVAGLMAQHFAGKVGAWELWNEPNTCSFMTPPDPAKYVAMVRAAYPAIKAADPQALVVASPTASVDVNYVTAEYKDGLHGYFDAMGVHPYNSNKPPNVNVTNTTADFAPGCWYSPTINGVTFLPALHDLMVKEGDGNKPVWATEWGFSSNKVSEANQGNYDIAELQAFANNYPYVTASFLYQARESATSNAEADLYGILHPDLSPKPAYTTLKNYLQSVN